jgi:hypothetical protein
VLSPSHPMDPTRSHLERRLWLSMHLAAEACDVALLLRGWPLHESRAGAGELQRGTPPTGCERNEPFAVRLGTKDCTTYHRLCVFVGLVQRL